MASQSFTYGKKGFTGDNVASGLTSTDSLSIDISGIPESRFQVTHMDASQVGDDLVYRFYETKKGTQTGTFTIEDAFATNGLKQWSLQTADSTELVALDTSVINADSYDFIGTSGDDTLTGTDNDDALYGSAGNDTLVGGGGDDEFYAGSGNDVMTGGEGEDLFRIGLASEIVQGSTYYEKTITDFNSDEGDVLLFQAYKTMKLKYTDKKTTDNWKAKNVVFETDGQDGFLLINLDADLDAEVTITFVGITSFDDLEIYA